MILFFDTETTGKAEFKLSHESPKQPHIVQLAAILCEDDGLERASLNVIITQDGYGIPKEASDIHGITDEIADSCGVPIAAALSMFAMLSRRATEVVAHNIDFDHLMMRAEFHRIGKPCRMDSLPRFCTMKAATDFCKLPGNYGSYKWPKLSEAYLHFIGSELQGAHDALADVRGCAAVYFAMNKTVNG